MNNQKKLSLAIYWHMHQPVYELEGTYLMPWVRLHAVKDYLDMVLYLEKFPKLKLNLFQHKLLQVLGMRSLVQEPVLVVMLLIYGPQGVMVKWG